MKTIEAIKRIAGVGLTAVGFADPRLAGISRAIIEAITTAETMPGKKGAQKALAAQEIVKGSLPDAIKAYEAMFGKEIADEALLAEALALQQEATVKILNAFRMLPKQ